MPKAKSWELEPGDPVRVSWDGHTVQGILHHIPTAQKPYWIVVDQHNHPNYFNDFRLMSREPSIPEIWGPNAKVPTDI